MPNIKVRASHELSSDMAFMKEWYEFENGWVMRREEDTLTPNGNRVAGRWVLRDDKGEFVDFDQYRHDLAERNGLDIGI